MSRILVVLLMLITMAGCADTPHETVRRRVKCEAILKVARTPADSALLNTVVPEVTEQYGLPCSYYMNLHRGERRQ